MGAGATAADIVKCKCREVDFDTLGSICPFLVFYFLRQKKGDVENLGFFKRVMGGVCMIFSAVGWSLLLCDFSATAHGAKNETRSWSARFVKGRELQMHRRMEIRLTHTGDNKALQLELF